MQESNVQGNMKFTQLFCRCEQTGDSEYGSQVYQQKQVGLFKVASASFLVYEFLNGSNKSDVFF